MDNIEDKSTRHSTGFSQAICASFIEDCDANINGFRLPIRVSDNEEYVNKLKDKLDKFKKAQCKASCYFAQSRKNMLSKTAQKHTKNTLFKYFVLICQVRYCYHKFIYTLTRENS